MQNGIRGEACRSIVICVDSYDEGIMTGRFYPVGQEDETSSFRSLTQLLIGVEHRLNAANFPQSFTSMRSFVPVVEPRFEGMPESKLRKGVLGTFLVKILFRQHTSWQGSVVWMEQRGEQLFRSALELILLMDSALSNRQEKQAVGN